MTAQHFFVNEKQVCVGKKPELVEIPKSKKGNTQPFAYGFIITCKAIRIRMLNMMKKPDFAQASQWVLLLPQDGTIFL